MKQAIYNCAQSALYLAANTGWKSYEEHLSQFTNYRGYYDAPYGAAAKAAVNTAAELPGEQARYAQSEVLRVQAAAKATICLALWQTLKRYASTSFPAEELKARLEEAGADYYKDASNENWDVVIMLNIQGKNFIHEHKTVLEAGNNMPVTFEAEYNTAAGELRAAVEAFIDSEEMGKEATEIKINANNAVYLKLIEMFKDGQEIFRGQDSIRDQFVFEKVLGLINGAGTAGLRGKITDSVTGLPVAGALLKVFGEEVTATSNDEGKYTLTPMASGEYKVMVSKDGYDTMEILKAVHVGVVSHLDFELTSGIV